MQPLQHDPASRERDGFRMPTRQAARDEIGIDEGLDAQRGQDGIRMRGLACAIRPGKDDHTGCRFTGLGAGFAHSSIFTPFQKATRPWMRWASGLGSG